MYDNQFVLLKNQRCQSASIILQYSHCCGKSKHVYINIKTFVIFTLHCCLLDSIGLCSQAESVCPPVQASASLCSAAFQCAQRGPACQTHGAACPWSPALPWRCRRRPVLSHEPAVCSGRSHNEALSSSRPHVLWREASSKNTSRKKPTSRIYVQLGLSPS